MVRDRLLPIEAPDDAVIAGERQRQSENTQEFIISGAASAINNCWISSFFLPLLLLWISIFEFLCGVLIRPQLLNSSDHLLNVQQFAKLQFMRVKLQLK